MTSHMNVEVVNFTPELATEYLDNYSWDRQRHLRVGHAEFLAEQMKLDRFRGNTIRLVYWEKKWHIVNGQHTLLAITESGCPQRLTLQKEWALSEDELNDIYAKTDVNIRRTVLDTMGVFNLRDKLGEVNGRLLPQYVVNGYGASLRFINEGFSVPRGEYDQSDLLKQMLDWAPSLRAYLKVIDPSDLYKRLSRRDCLAVALVTYQYISDHKRVDDFWHLLATDDMLPQYDVRKGLRRFLIQTSGTSQGASGQSGIVTERGARLVAKAWNHYWRGKLELKNLSVSDHRSPMVILGTPFGRKSAAELQDMESDE